jgi:hypothetical protein
MSKINWINIFKLYEVNKYCKFNDLSELSMVCKAVRSSLRYAIFKYFNLETFITCSEYQGCVISMDGNDDDVWTFSIVNHYKPLADNLLENKRRFISELDLYKHNIDRLNFYDVLDYFYLLYELPNIFQNLKSLYFDSTVIMFDNFQTLMSNLNILEDLDLYYVYICKRSKESKSINFPLTLKKLKLRLVPIVQLNEREENIIFRRDIFISEYHPELELPLKNLPNLLLLRYKPISNENDGNNLLEFLKHNQNIKYIYILHLNFNPEVFNLVKTFKNLVKFGYSELYFSNIVNTDLLDSLVGGNVKYLSVSLSENSSYLKILPKQFPNLTDLYIDNGLLEFDQLWSILPKFKNLKTLKLKFYDYLIYSKDLSSQIFPNLESIHLMPDNDLNIEAINFNINSFPKLKLISFSHRGYPFINLGNIKLSHEAKANWRLIDFSSKISLYRIK